MWSIRWRETVGITSFFCRIGFSCYLSPVITDPVSELTNQKLAWCKAVWEAHRQIQQIILTVLKMLMSPVNIVNVFLTNKVHFQTFVVLFPVIVFCPLSVFCFLFYFCVFSFFTSCLCDCLHQSSCVPPVFNFPSLPCVYISLCASPCPGRLMVVNVSCACRPLRHLCLF